MVCRAILTCVSMLAVVDRLMPEGSLMVPPATRVAGRWARAVGGEWDWFYGLSDADRRRVLRHCKPGGVEPDVCARAAGFEYVDEWADELVAAILAKRAVWEAVSEYPDSVALAPDALVGPVEVAELCGVKVDTVYQWVTRGRLPEPWSVVSGTRLWPRHEIESWALASGRLVHHAEPDF